MTDTEPWGQAHQSNCNADGVASANTNKTKKSNNKIPQDLKRGTHVKNHIAQPSRRSANASTAGYRRARNERNSWNAMMPHLMVRLGADMKAQLLESSPSDEDKVRVERCFELMQATVKELGPRWSLEVFGSVASGFSTSSSDMDATCVLAPVAEGEEDEDQPSAKTILLERLSPLFRDKPEFRVTEEIPSAKVPILRLRFEDHLDIDLSSENTGALRNTRLLRAYAQLDPRVRDLGVAVKLWAKAASVCGAAQSKLSSYTFTLLMIYFMQVHRQVQLPCLSPGLFEDNADPQRAAEALETASLTWSCHLELPELFYHFIMFYCHDFKWGQEVASPRIGQRRNPRDGVFDKLRGRYVPRIHVEDPYLLERNLHCVLGETEERQLIEAFQHARDMLYCGLTPAGLCGGIGGQKLELQLSELTGQSPQSSPEMRPAMAPQISFTDDPEAEVAKFAVTTPLAHTAEPPGVFSSAGSTESGDTYAQNDTCVSSSGESRCSDDEAASGERPRRFLSLESVESSMVHKQDIAAIAKTPVNLGQVILSTNVAPAEDSQLPWAPQQSGLSTPAGGPPGQWWLNLGSNDVKKAVEAVNSQDRRTSKSLTVHTVEDLERQMTDDAAAKIGPLFGRSFANSATSKIATRLTNQCFSEHFPCSVQVA
jgi:DNA polymerase sigma